MARSLVLELSYLVPYLDAVHSGCIDVVSPRALDSFVEEFHHIPTFKHHLNLLYGQFSGNALPITVWTMYGQAR